MNRIIEYIIQMKDRTTAGLQSALSKVKKFGDTVTSTMAKSSKAIGTSGWADEKFIHTARVLDTVGKALEKMGVEGEQLNDTMDTLEKQLNLVNKNGGDTAQLFEHFKLSMADVGMTTKQINDGLAMLKRNLVGAGESGAQAGKSIRSDLKTTHLIIGAMSGNVYSLGRAFTFLLGKIKALKLSASTLSMITLGVYALSEMVSKCVEWWKRKKEAMEKVQELRFEDTLKKYSKEQSEINREMKRTISSIDMEVERKKLLIKHNAKLIEQQIEMNRLAALQGTKGSERDAINKDFDAQKSQLKAKTAIQLAEVEAAGQADIDAELAKLEVKLAPIEKRMRTQLKELDDEVKRQEEAKRKDLASERVLSRTFIAGGGVIENRGVYSQEEQKDRFETWQAEDEEYRKLRDRRDKLQEQYNGIVDDLNDFADRREKAQLKASQLRTEAEETATDAGIDELRALEEAEHEYYAEMERLERERTKQAEREARERNRVQKELMREAADEYRATLRDLTEQERSATSSLREAEQKVTKAWGWYKDSGEMQKYIDEQTQELAARQKYQKDVKALERGSWGDELATAKRLNRLGETDKLEEMFAKWRKGSMGLSVEQEATMRVAVAKDEEKQAQKTLEEIRDQMNEASAEFERIADAIDNIEGLLEDGGGE